ATSAGGRRGYLWTQPYGSTTPRLLRTTPPIGEEETDALAAGPNGTWAALERSVGNTSSSYRLDVVSSRGGGAHVTTSSTPILLAGDGTFLGYLEVTAAGGVQLYRISGAHGIHVADLAGVSAPQEVAVASGHLALREVNGTVAVFTDGGARLATIPANAASVALTSNRVVVRTRNKRLVVYGLRGGLVHNWRLGAQSWTAGLAAYGAYAVYLGANKAVHVVRLVNGSDRIVARAGTGFFFGGVALQKAGALVPLTSGQTTTFRFVPARSL
ncbi:MAG TPA: hypothetical protein VHV52_06525, partial [Gaiellaceae bacterium]|nr:hypothetical protein [Gaiellaceae bacterium]